MAEFFDKMMVGINKGANSISTGSKNLMAKAKLNTEIKDAEKEKDKLAELLGKRALELYLGGTEIPEELRNFCDEMKKRDDIIAEKREKIRELEEKKDQTEEAGAAAPIVCSCGHSNKATAKFCANCGNKLQ